MGEELQESLKSVMEDQLQRMKYREGVQRLTPYETMMMKTSATEWKKAEFTHLSL